MAFSHLLSRVVLIRLQEVLPEVCLAVNTRQAARLMLNATPEKINHLEEAGALPEPQAKAMIAQVRDISPHLPPSMPFSHRCVRLSR